MIISDIVTTTRASTGTYFDAAGVMQTAPINTWRRDHDPLTGAGRGVLIEEARTNSMLQSANPGGAGYTVTGMTVTMNGGIAPDGTMTANLLVEDASTGLHRTSQIPSGVPTAGTVFWNEAFVRKFPGSVRNIVQIENLQYGNHTRRTTAFYDLDAEQYISVVGTLPEAIVQKLPNGWFRFFNLGEANGNGVVGLNVGLSSGTTASYTGDGTSGIYVWGFGRQDGLFPTSYIPTTTAAATRAADAMQITNGWSKPWFNPSTGTILVEGQTFDSTLSNRFIERSFGNNGVIVGISANPTGRANAQLVGFGGSVTFNAKGAVGRGSYAKIGYAYSLPEAGMSVDGLPVETVSRGTPLPAGIDGHLLIGYSSVTGYLNGHIKRIQYWPRRLSDTELQAASVLS